MGSWRLSWLTLAFPSSFGHKLGKAKVSQEGLQKPTGICPSLLCAFSLHTLHESTTYPQQPNEITERDGPGNRGEPKGSCPLEHTKENAKQWPCKDNMQATTHTMYRIYTREEKTCIQFGSPSRHRFRAIAVRHVWKLETEAQSTTVCGKPL